MTKDPGGTASRHIRTLFNQGTVAVLTDGQLLERFATRSNESAELAFAALIERHGPMVLGICRRLLADPHEAQDAFQATFLVLVRRLDSIRKRDSIASWLHGVARRTASCARFAAARRIRHERQAAARLPTVFSSAEDREEVGAILHEELGRLPERYRSPIVLCDLEGRTHAQAAQQLGWPVGTVKSRLARGRERLRDRLIRRGLTPAVGFGVLLADGITEAAVAMPAALVDATSRAATCAAAGRALIGVVPTSVFSLTTGVLRSMCLTRLAIAAVATLTMSAVILGTCGHAYQAPGHAAVQTPPKDGANALADPSNWSRREFEIVGIEDKFEGLLRTAREQRGRSDFRMAIRTVSQIERMITQWRVALDGHTPVDRVGEEVRDPRQRARILLMYAREKIARGDLSGAEKHVTAGRRSLGVHFGLYDDTPDKVAVELKETRSAAPSPEMGRE